MERRDELRGILCRVRYADFCRRSGFKPKGERTIYPINLIFRQMKPFIILPRYTPEILQFKSRDFISSLAKKVSETDVILTQHNKLF